MLAISLTAIDVAFVGALAALMAAIAAPLTSWVITRAGQQHDRLMARDERNYTTRSAVYVDVLKDIHADLTSITEMVRLFDEPGADLDRNLMPQPATVEFLADLRGRLAAFGSEKFFDAYSTFTAQRSAWARTFVDRREAGGGTLTTDDVLELKAERKGLQVAAHTSPLLPELAAALPGDVQLDGELVALDETGRPGFHRLSSRMLHAAARRGVTSP